MHAETIMTPGRNNRVQNPNNRFMQIRQNRGKAGFSLDRGQFGTIQHQQRDSKIGLQYNNSSIPYIQKRGPQLQPKGMSTFQAKDQRPAFNTIGTPLQNQRLNAPKMPELGMSNLMPTFSHKKQTQPTYPVKSTQNPYAGSSLLA